MAEEDERPAKEFPHPMMQQKLPQFFPQYAPQTVVLCLFLVAIAFIPIGGAVIVASASISEIDVQYDHIAQGGKGCTEANNDGLINSTLGDGSVYSRGCKTRATFTLTEGLVGPIYMYYRLVGFHQNYRMFAESKSEAQLIGEEVSASVMGDCDPKLKPSQTAGQKSLTVSGQSTSYDGMVYNPCGQIAWAMFNDTVKLYKVADKAAVSQTGDLPATAALVCDASAFDAAGNPTLAGNSCSKKDIAFTNDRNVRFVAASTSASVWTGDTHADTDDVYLANGWYANEAGHNVPLNNDQDFMVWSRIASLADFRKLHRFIDVELQAGDYVFDIEEQFDMASLGGEKHLILATTSFVGGENFVLGILYVLVGTLSFVLAVGFLVFYLLKE